MEDSGIAPDPTEPEPEPELLRRFLGGRDAACPGCGYNLRDLPGSRCPECGDELVLRVGLVEPRQAAGIAGLIGLAAGGGMNALLLGYFLIRFLVFREHFSGFEKFVVLNGGGLVVEGLALTLWLRRWRTIRRLPRQRKRLLVAGCWLLTLTNLVVFSTVLK